VTHGHQGAACDAVSVHFGRTVRRTDVFVLASVSRIVHLVKILVQIVRHVWVLLLPTTLIVRGTREVSPVCELVLGQLHCVCVCVSVCVCLSVCAKDT